MPIGHKSHAFLSLMIFSIGLTTGCGDAASPPMPSHSELSPEARATAEKFQAIASGKVSAKRTKKAHR